MLGFEKLKVFSRGFSFVLMLSSFCFFPPSSCIEVALEPGLKIALKTLVLDSFTRLRYGGRSFFFLRENLEKIYSYMLENHIITFLCLKVRFFEIFAFRF